MSVHPSTPRADEQDFDALVGGHKTAGAVLAEARRTLGLETSKSLVARLESLSDLTTPQNMGAAIFQVAEAVKMDPARVDAELRSPAFETVLQNMDLVEGSTS